LDDTSQRAALLLKQDEVLCKANHDQDDPEIEFQPEFGRYQLEATPGHPYNNSLDSILSVERNMTRRSVATITLSIVLTLNFASDAGLLNNN
jgi:glutamate--cysteine ligase catalytic subunit